MTTQLSAEPSREHAMSPAEVLAEELASAFNQFEREARLKVECSVSTLERRDAERELLFVRVVQELRDKAGLLKDGRDGVDGKDGQDADVTEIRADILTELRSIADRETSRVSEALAVVRNGEHGRDGVDGKDGRDGEPGQNGRDADPQEIAQRLLPEIERAVAAIPVPRDGKDADPAAVAGLVAEEVQRAVSGLPVPKDGVDGKDGAPGAPAEIPLAPPDISEMVSRAIALYAMPAVSSDVHVPQPVEKLRQKTITMTKDRHGNAVARVVEEPN